MLGVSSHRKGSANKAPADRINRSAAVRECHSLGAGMCARWSAQGDMAAGLLFYPCICAIASVEKLIIHGESYSGRTSSEQHFPSVFYSWAPSISSAFRTLRG
jgi:hypothetical protein